ncbi:MAG: DUF262 domain-containing protein [Propylenella sp.]
MKSETYDIQQLFQDRRQYRVPFYQRPYVWKKEEQWEPLWNDIIEKSEARADGSEIAPHFLGAIVLEPQERQGLKGVETYHIIDGQQRLTTLQYFLSALAMRVRAASDPSLASAIENCLWNTNPDTMQNPEVERFKVWPTFRDREPYRSAMSAEGPDELRSRFAASFTQGGSLRKIGWEHPAALEAIWFFHDKIGEALSANDAQGTPAQRLEQLTISTLRDLKVVWISLEANDDAQVIFETLNGRGAELHATDLIRNFIFMRADREKADAAALYDDLWTPFEAPFWSEEQRRGRLRKPRLEWFMQTALQAESADSVEIGRLYTSYRKFGMGSSIPVPAERQLRLLNAHAEAYRQLTNGVGETPIARFGKRMWGWDASPTHSLALRVVSLDLPAADQNQICEDIVSYLVRRAVCGLTPKNYNNVFFQLLRKFRGDGATSAAFHQALSALEGQASRWPSDEEFRRAWLAEPIHRNLGDVSRIRVVLTELENQLRSQRNEEPFVPTLGQIDVDHIMPEKWYQHWPLDGQLVTPEEASSAFFATIGQEEPSERVEAINRRERLKATMGNLTLVHYGVNRSLQHGAFPEKRERLFAESNLHLNRPLMRLDGWNEKAIEQRGQTLFDVARVIWRGPTRAAPL